MEKPHDTTVYVALLRGINVGGKAKVEMAKLKVTFERLGFESVRTYINSGNVIFRANAEDEAKLKHRIEAAVEQDFGLAVPVVLRDQHEMQRLVTTLPKTWVNDTDMRCDVMFLWPNYDRPEIVAQFPHQPEIEDVVYYPGAVVWRVDRVNVRRGQVPKIIGMDVYKHLTIRNVSTVRALYELMRAT